MVYKKKKLDVSSDYESLENSDGSDKMIVDDEYKNLVIEENIAKDTPTDTFSAPTKLKYSQENIFRIYGCPDNIYSYYKNLQIKEKSKENESLDPSLPHHLLENFEIVDNSLDVLLSHVESARLFERIFKIKNRREDNTDDSSDTIEYDFDNLKDGEKAIINKSFGKILKRKYGK